MFICCEYGWWCEEYIFSQSKPHGKWHTKSGLGKRLKAIAVATALSDCLEYEDLIVEKMERKRCSSNRRRRVDGWRRRRKSGKSYSRNGEQGAIVSEEEIDRDEL